MKSGIEKILIIGLLIYCFVFVIATQCKADFPFEEDKPAIRNTRIGIVYTNFDIAAENANSGDTFELGLYSDTEGWELNQAEGYSGLYQKYNYLNPNITKNSKGCIIELYFITELNLRFGKINYYADDEITYLNSSFYAVKE